MTGGEKQATRRALDKRIRTALNEKLMMEVEMSIPQDVTDVRADKERVAEVVVKLISKLKQGPLMEGKTDEQWLNGAIKFLVTNLGKVWSQSYSCTLLLIAKRIAYKTIVRSWFQPHTVENDSASAVPTAVAGKVNAKSTVQEIAQNEGQGSLSNTSGTHHLSALIDMMPSLPTSVRDSSGTMPLGTTHPGSVSRPPTPKGSAAGMESAQPVLDSMSIQVCATEAAMPPLSANEFARGPAWLVPGTSQHERSHSDPGQVHICLIRHKFYWMSTGSPHPTVSLIRGDFDRGRYASPVGYEE